MSFHVFTAGFFVIYWELFIRKKKKKVKGSFLIFDITKTIIEVPW
jgi:hypothetical protein